MKKFTSLLMLLLASIGMAQAQVLPTEPLKASQILPSDGTPENQFYVRATKDGGNYWTSSTVNTNNVANAGKFAFYAVPGLENCYYIYSVDEKKWVNYNKTNRDNQKSFVKLEDNFDANAYWKISEGAKQHDNAACYQLNPTVYTTNQSGVLNIKTDRYANWFQGADGSSTLGLWQQGASADEGSAWSIESVNVTSDLKVQLSQRIAVANEILANFVEYTKGTNLLTADNVASIVSSPYTSTQEGSIANLVDGSAGSSNHWHSDYSAGDKINGSHYITVNLGESTPELLSFVYARRKDVANDHTTRWAIYGVPADETGVTSDSRAGLTLLAMVSTPFASHSESFDNLLPFKTQGFKKFRFYSDATNQNRGYFHIGEFQLNGYTIAESSEARVNELVAAVATAEAVETPTQSDIDALNAKISLFVLSDEDKARGEALLALTGVGYPSATSEVRVALQNVLANDASTALELNEAIANFKASTDIALPENGKAYQFAFVANDNDLTNYKIVANGTTLSVSADAEATTFYCVKYTNVDGNERYAFVSPEGNFLAYHALSDTYRTHEGADKRLQNDFSFASMLSLTSNIGANTEVKRFGTVTIKADNRILGDNGRDGYFILKFSADNKPFDKSSAPFFNDDYTSALKVTEVSAYEPNNAVLVAASTINPLIQGYKRIGEGLGQYAYTFGENSGNVFADFESLVNANSTAITDANYSFAINMPTAGFYRIKSMNGNDANKKGKYIQTDGGDLALTTEATVNSIMYLDGSYNLVSYALGAYLNTYKAPEAKGAAATAWTFKENAQVVGAYTLDNPADKQGDSELFFLSDWTGGVTYGNDDANAAWMLEEVNEIPVTISAAGYATFYAPVALTLPAELTAYIVSVNGEWATLNEIVGDVIPANTGVVLQGAPETYNLTVAESAETISGNELLGTVAASYVTDDAYVLGYVGEDGNKEVGFYTATKNFNDANEKVAEGGVKWLNNGFKAYLPKPVSGARFLNFDFGTETGIGEVETETENAVIFDLAGRRVQKAQKGLYIVNGKKVIK